MSYHPRQPLSVPTLRLRGTRHAAARYSRVSCDVSLSICRLPFTPVHDGFFLLSFNRNNIPLNPSPLHFPPIPSFFVLLLLFYPFHPSGRGASRSLPPHYHHHHHHVVFAATHAPLIYTNSVDRHTLLSSYQLTIITLLSDTLRNPSLTQNAFVRGYPLS